MKKFKSLFEQKEKVVFTFGRFNPPTTGHEKLIDKVAKSATGADYFIYPSFSQNSKKDPLPAPRKVAYMKAMFKKHARNIVLKKGMNTVLDIAVDLHNRGYKDVTMVVGSDRVSEFEKLLMTYNGQDKRHGFYKFDNISIISAGERDPDAEGVSGMSASKMRAAAAENDFDTFKLGLPKRFNQGQQLFADVRKYMGLKESSTYSEEEIERDLYVRGTLYQIGDLVENKRDGTSGEIVRRGPNYVQYSDGENFYKAFLHSIQEVKQDKDVDDKKGTQPAKYYAGDMAKSTKDKRDAHFKKGTKMSDDNPDAYKPAPGDTTMKTKKSQHTKKFKQMYGEGELDEMSWVQKARDIIHRMIHPKGYEKIMKMYIDLVKKRDSNPIATVSRYTGENPRDIQYYINDLIKKGKLPKQLMSSYTEGLWDNIRKKRARIKRGSGEKMRKKGEKGAPSSKEWQKAQEQKEHEITVGDYTTTHFFMCGSAQKVMKKHASKEGAEELTRIQDVFYKMEKEAMNTNGASEEQKKKAQILYDKIITKAKEIGIEKEVDSYMKMHLNSMIKGEPKLGFGRTDLNESFQLDEKIAGLVKKAEKSGMPYSILKKVYDRGMAAWRTGNRPGTTPQQWAFARVNSFTTKSSGTWGKADKDLAKQVRGENYEEGEDYARHTFAVTPGQDYEQSIKKKASKSNIKDWFERESVRKEYQKKYEDYWWTALTETYDRMLEKIGTQDDSIDKYLDEGKAEYQGRKVNLNNPTKSDNPKKKYMVYVKNDKGNVVKVHYGDPNMQIQRDDDAARKSFRARHQCDTNPGPKYKARYWSCKFWEKGKSVTDLMKG